MLFGAIYGCKMVILEEDTDVERMVGVRETGIRGGFQN